MSLCDVLLPLLGPGALVAARHLGPVAGLAGGAHLDGGVLKRGGGHRHLTATLRKHTAQA